MKGAPKASGEAFGEPYDRPLRIPMGRFGSYYLSAARGNYRFVPPAVFRSFSEPHKAPQDQPLRLVTR